MYFFVVYKFDKKILIFLYIFLFDSIAERVLEISYHGLVKENETLVEITPEIKIDESKKICLFEIEKKKNQIPFTVSFYLFYMLDLKKYKVLILEKCFKVQFRMRMAI